MVNLQRSITFLTILVIACSFTTAKSSKLIEVIDSYLKIKPSDSQPKMPHVGIGSMDGCLLDDEFWEIYFHLKLRYPQYISNLERFGLSFEKRHMVGFWLETQAPDCKVSKISYFNLE